MMLTANMCWELARCQAYTKQITRINSVNPPNHSQVDAWYYHIYFADEEPRLRNLPTITKLISEEQGINPGIRAFTLLTSKVPAQSDSLSSHGLWQPHLDN